MKRILYTILSILSIAYIGFLIVDVIRANTAWNPNMGGFEQVFNFIVRFGGVAIIFCFALVNFAGSPLKTVFFILLIIAIVLYVIITIVTQYAGGLFAKASAETIVSVMNFRA